MNMLYADVDGNIGYQMVGRVPVRDRGEGLVPSPGWSGQYEWRGSVDFDDLPRAFNPPDGLWANANHNVGKHNPHFFIARVHRPGALPAHPTGARKQSSTIRRSTSARCRPTRSACRRGAWPACSSSTCRPAGRLERRALDELRGWDGRIGADSAAASIYEVFRNELIRARHGEALGDMLPALLGVGPHPLLGSGDVALLPADAARARFRRGLADDPAVRRAFRATVVWLVAAAGTETSAAGTGDACTRCAWSTRCPMRKPLGMLFDVPSFPWSGDLETVRAGGYLPGQLAAGGPISAYRLIADCGDWDNSLSCIPGGQSGHRGSPNYADQVDAWRRVAYHPLSFTRPAIARSPDATRYASRPALKPSARRGSRVERGLRQQHSRVVAQWPAGPT